MKFKQELKIKAPCQTVTTTAAPCATPCDPCSKNPCQNGGLCFNSSCNAVCNCASGFAGTYCQTSVTTQTSEIFLFYCNADLINYKKL